MIYYVEVAVALQRPPGIDEFRHTAVEADSPGEAELIAAQIAACTSTMPVWALVVGDEEFRDYDG